MEEVKWKSGYIIVDDNFYRSEQRFAVGATIETKEDIKKSPNGIHYWARAADCGYLVSLESRPRYLVVSPQSAPFEAFSQDRPVRTHMTRWFRGRMKVASLRVEKELTPAEWLSLVKSDADVDKECLQDLVELAAVEGNVSLMEQAFAQARGTGGGPLRLNAALQYTVQFQRQAAMQWALERGADPKFALIEAAGRGFIPIMESVTSSGTWTGEMFNVALVHAADCGKVSAMEFCISRGATLLDVALKGAVICECLPSVKFLIAKGAPVTEESVVQAALDGNCNIMGFLLKSSTVSLDRALCTAARMGHTQMIALLIKSGATHLESAALAALERGQLEQFQDGISAATRPPPSAT